MGISAANSSLNPFCVTVIALSYRQLLGSSGFMGISAANSSLNPFCVTVIALSYRQLLYQLYTIYHSNPEEPIIVSIIYHLPLKPRRAELDIVGFMEPADEVGGDYYDVLQRNGRIKIGIGDVTGHGLESGVIMIMLQTAIRTLLINGERNTVKFLSTINRTIYENLQRMNCDKSLSLILMDYHDHKLNISGQHENVIVVRNNGEVEIIDTDSLGFPIGLTDEITEFIFELEIHLDLGSSGFMGISAANSSLNPFCVTVIALSYRQLLYQLYTIYHSNPEEPRFRRYSLVIY